MFDKDRKEFSDKLEDLFDEYHHAIYLIDSVWEMKDKIQAEVLAYKEDSAMFIDDEEWEREMGR